MEDKTYNGWVNYETWLFNLNVCNDESTQELMYEITESIDNGRYMSYEKVSAFKEQMEELFFVEEYQIYKVCYDSFDLRSWNEIDFYEIFNNFVEEIEERDSFEGDEDED